MAFQNHICRLCFNIIIEEDIQVLNQSVKEMLETLLININLSISENPVICKSCHRRLEENYTFKKRCIFTEDRLAPFVAENVKINLNEIRDLIIKSDDTEVDKNVCRLCLEYVDNDMILNQQEKNQFQEFIPEIKWNLTNFIALCINCYDTLQKYFIFITSCSQLEDQLCSYYAVYNTEQNGSIKLEDFRQFLINARQNIPLEQSGCSGQVVSNELDIKSEQPDSAEEKDLHSNSYTWKSSNLRTATCDTELANIEDAQKSNSQIPKDCSNQKIFTCVFNDCDYRTEVREDLREHTQLQHSNMPKHQCYQCDYAVRSKTMLRNHILCKHTDPSAIVMYKCKDCDYQCKMIAYLRKHIIRHHTDISKIKMFNCDKCSYASKFKYNLKLHISNHHSNDRKETMLKREIIRKKSLPPCKNAPKISPVIQANNEKQSGQTTIKENLKKRMLDILKS